MCLMGQWSPHVGVGIFSHDGVIVCNCQDSLEYRIKYSHRLLSYLS